MGQPFCGLYEIFTFEPGRSMKKLFHLNPKYSIIKRNLKFLLLEWQEGKDIINESGKTTAIGFWICNGACF